MIWDVPFGRMTQLVPPVRRQTLLTASRSMKKWTVSPTCALASNHVGPSLNAELQTACACSCCVDSKVDSPIKADMHAEAAMRLHWGRSLQLDWSWLVI